MRTKETRRSKDTRKRTKKCMRTQVFRTLGGKLPSDGGGVPSALHTTTTSHPSGERGWLLDFWDRDWERLGPFPNLGTGTVKKNAFPTFGNRNGNEELRYQFFATGMTYSFQFFWNRSERTNFRPICSSQAGLKQPSRAWEYIGGVSFYGCLGGDCGGSGGCRG